MNLKDFLKKKKICLWLIILLVFFLFLNQMDSLFLWDENAYLANGRNILSQSAYSEDFRFPFIGYVLASMWFITGESVFIAKLTMILFTLGTAYLFYLISRKYFDDNHSLLMTVMFSLSSLIIYWGFRVYADIISLFFIVLSFYFFLNEDKYGKKGLLLAGIFGSVAFIARFSSFILIIAQLIYLLIKKRPKCFGILLLGALIAAAPWLLANFIWHGDPLHNLVAQWDVVSMYTHPEPLDKHVFNFIISMHLLIIFMPAGIYSLYKRKADKWFFILLYLIIFDIYFAFFVNLKDLRYYLIALPFLFIWVGEGLLWMKKHVKYSHVFTIVALISVLISAFYMVSHITERGACENNGALMQSISYVCSNVNTGDMIISNVWPYYGYPCNVSAVSTWSDIKELLVHHDPSYVIYHDRGGLDYERAQLDENLILDETLNGICGEKVYIYVQG